MALAIYFWIGMFIWLLIGGYWTWRPPAERWVGGWFLLPFLLLLILGWATFGSPVK